MQILDFSQVLMYEFHYDDVKIKHGSNSRLLFTDTDTLMYKIKTKGVYEDFSKDKDIFYFSCYTLKSKYYCDSNKLVVGKMKDETAGVLAIEEFIKLKPKMCLFSVDDSSEHKIAKNVNKNIVATTSHSDYKHALLNNKCLRHSMNRIQSKNHKTIYIYTT